MGLTVADHTIEIISALDRDHGWREVAQIALDFVQRFVPAKPSYA